MGTVAERFLAELAEADARVERAARALSDAQLAWHPPEGGWSIAEVLEHLCIANDSYLGRLRVLVVEARHGGGTAPRASRAGDGDDGWRPSLMGGLLARSLRAPKKLRAPRIYRVTSAPRPGVLDAFLESEREIAALLRDSLALDWRRTRLSSPVSRLVRLTLGDAFDVLAAHSARHARQVERLRAHPAFPAA